MAGSNSEIDAATMRMVRIVRWFMLLGVLALAYVILRSCSTPKQGLNSFGRGTLSNLVVQEAGLSLPGLRFTDPDGVERRLVDLEGKTLLVNFWGSWCPPCVKELPSLIELQRLRGGDDFEVVLINVNETPEKAQTFLDREGLSAARTWYDSSYRALSEFDLKKFPTTILYRANKTELARVVGEADWASPEALSLIDYAVANP